MRDAGGKPALSPVLGGSKVKWTDNTTALKTAGETVLAGAALAVGTRNRR